MTEKPDYAADEALAAELRVAATAVAEILDRMLESGLTAEVVFELTEIDMTSMDDRARVYQSAYQPRLTVARLIGEGKAP